MSLPSRERPQALLATVVAPMRSHFARLVAELSEETKDRHEDRTVRMEWEQSGNMLEGGHIAEINRSSRRSNRENILEGGHIAEIDRIS